MDLEGLDDYDSEDEYTFISGNLKHSKVGDGIKNLEDSLRCPIVSTF